MKVSTTIVDNGKPSTPKSFLRWIGGKRLLINKLFNYLPQDWSKRRYFEPFAGAANLFFRLRPEKAVLADLNEPLIECYKQVRDRYPTIAGHIREHKKNNSKEYYYKIRDIYNHTRYGPAQAARFIYLNQTCFNGIFRVNLY